MKTPSQHTIHIICVESHGIVFLVRIYHILLSNLSTCYTPISPLLGVRFYSIIYHTILHMGPKPCHPFFVVHGCIVEYCSTVNITVSICKFRGMESSQIDSIRYFKFEQVYKPSLQLCVRVFSTFLVCLKRNKKVN